MRTFEYYVEKAKEIYEDKYQYVRDFRKNNGDRCFEIICDIHGSFEKKITNHINKKQGCPSCSKKLKLTQKDFLIKANEIHGNKYDYSKTIYITGHTKSIITCKIHGDFNQSLKNHMSGQGCPHCSTTPPINTELFIERAIKLYGDKYDYSKSEYISLYEPLIIICKTHGEFNQNPSNHLDNRNENACYKCSNRNVRNTEDFIEKSTKIHNNLYDYSNVDYKISIEKVIIICKKHGEFKQRPNDHLGGDGCPKCCNKFSKISIAWLNEIIEKENIYIQHALNDGEYTIKINNKKYYCDGFCKKTNTIYEFNGDFYHGNPDKFNPEDLNPVINKTYGELYKNTLIKEENIKKAGYNLITIWESDYRMSNSIL